VVAERGNWQHVLIGQQATATGPTEIATMRKCGLPLWVCNDSAGAGCSAYQVGMNAVHCDVNMCGHASSWRVRASNGKVRVLTDCHVL
jgi:hypothetical protein